MTAEQQILLSVGPRLFCCVRNILVVIVACGLLMAAGCTSPEESTTENSPRTSSTAMAEPTESTAAPTSPMGPQLLGAFLHPELELAVYVDVDAVGAGLGITQETVTPENVRLLTEYLSMAAPMFAGRTTTVPLPIQEALDLLAIRESISSQVGRGPTVSAAVRTDQPWEQVAQALEAAGYADRGDGILTIDARITDVRYTAIGSRGDVIVTGQDPDLVAEQLSATTAGPEDLLEILNETIWLGPLRAAYIQGDGGCGRVRATGTEAPSSGGTWAIRVGPDADPERIHVQPNEEWRQLVTEQPRLDGDWLVVDLTRSDASDGLTPSTFKLFFAVDGLEPPGSLYQEYRCP